jgi:hypothetical protein
LSFRIQQTEKDLAGFVQGKTNETGAMVLNSDRGKNTPVLCQSEDDVLINAGYPSADYPSVFEAVAFVRKAPLYIVCPYGTGSLWGGIMVKEATAEAFTYGQIVPTSFVFTGINTLVEAESIGTGNGVNATFSGVVTNVPIDTGTLEINVNGSGIVATESGGVISGAGISGNGNINLAGGNFEFTLATVPGSGVPITIDYVYDYDGSSDVSHVIMAASPYTDDLAIDLEATSGNQFTLKLYKVSSGVDNYISTYKYSLTREKDNFGKTLYYEDVFRNDPYLTVVKNSSFSLVSAYSVDVSSLDLSGGSRVAAESSDITTAWNQFQNANKYKARIFMDAIGGYSSTINTVITTYQPYAHGLTPISLGNNAEDAITERQGYSLNSDNMSIYTNWQYIKDPYSDSYAWINGIGSVGKKYAMMADIYDSGSPAGIDEDNHGGLLNDWEYQEVEYDYSDSQLSNLDDAQINPIIWDQDQGVMVYGDKTAQSTLSDVSYIGHRRMYNFILETIINQVLKKQVFKNNDVIHRARAKAMVDDFIRSTVYAVSAVREWLCVVDTTNNTDEILDQRRFIVDIYIKVFPNAQVCHLKLTRVSQGQVISELISG